MRSKGRYVDLLQLFKPRLKQCFIAGTISGFLVYLAPSCVLCIYSLVD